MLSNLTIESIAARAVLAPIPRPLRTASGDILAAPLALVDVQTSEGIVGRGYAFAYVPLMLRSLVQFLRDVESDLVGKAVAPRERMRQLEEASMNDDYMWVQLLPFAIWLVVILV